MPEVRVRGSDGSSRSVLITIAGQAPDVVVPAGGSLQTAYNACPAGGIIEMRGGSYGNQALTGTKQVTFRARAGELPRLLDLSIKASNVTFQGVRTREIGISGANNVTFEDCDLNGDGMSDPVLPLYVANVTGLKLRRCQIGNVVTAKNILLDIRVDDVLFEDCLLHDVRVTNDTFHNEGMYVNHVRGLVMRRCRFERIATMDCFLTQSGTGQVGKNFWFEDCYFAATTKADGTTHVQTLALNKDLVTIDGLVLLRNHFELGINSSGMRAINSRAQGNTGDMGPTIPGMTYQ